MSEKVLTKGPFQNRSIKASQVTEVLIDLDKHIREVNEWGEASVLTEDEIAFDQKYHKTQNTYITFDCQSWGKHKKERN